MKTILLGLALLPVVAFGQSKGTINYNQFYLMGRYFEGYDENPMKFNQQLMRSIEGKDIKKITRTVQFKSKKSYSTEFFFNNRQRVTSIRYDEDKEVRYSYLNDTLLERIEGQRKHPYYTNYTYENGNLVLKESYEKERLKSRLTVLYGEGNKIRFSSVENKKKKRSYSLYNEYDGDKLKHQRYMVNGKVSHEWDYGCKEEGELVQKEHQSNVCEYREESNDGSYIVYTRKITGEHVLLTKAYYTSDSTWYMTERLNEDNQLVSKSLKDGNTSTFIRYNTKKGAEEYRSASTVDDQGRVVSLETQWKGNPKKTSSITYEYNEEGLLTQETNTYHNKTSRVTTYEYEM